LNYYHVKKHRYHKLAVEFNDKLQTITVKCIDCNCDLFLKTTFNRTIIDKSEINEI